jgi:hypothetical protein
MAKSISERVEGREQRIMGHLGTRTHESTARHHRQRFQFSRERITRVELAGDTDRAFGASFDREARGTRRGWTRFRKPGAYNDTARHPMQCAE